MLRRNILIGTLAISVVVATIGGVAYVLHTRAQADGASYPGLHGPVSVVCPGPTYSGITGSTTGRDGHPAIHPHNDCAPSFTQQDVRDFLAQGRLFLGAGFGVTGKWTVSRVIFLTISDFIRAVGPGESTWAGGYPPTMLICYVGLRGRFELDIGGGPESLSSVSIVFDAHTGNGLVSISVALLGRYACGGASQHGVSIWTLAGARSSMQQIPAAAYHFTRPPWPTSQSGSSPGTWHPFAASAPCGIC